MKSGILESKGIRAYDQNIYSQMWELDISSHTQVNEGI